MRRADAPPPGWYPDPTGGQRLWWWDGLDWTQDKRVAPRAGRLAMVEEAALAAREKAAAGQGVGQRSQGHGVAPRIGSGISSAAQGAGVPRQDTAAIVEEVRRVTRSEIERATRGLGGRATDARRQLEPLISEYGTKLVGWARRLVVIGVLVYILYLALTTAIQTGLLDWVGDRIDNAVNGTAITFIHVDESTTSTLR